MLEEGVHAVTVGRGHTPGELCKGVGDGEVEEDEEGVGRREDGYGVREKVGGAIPVDGDGNDGEGREEPAPEEERSFLTGPEGGEEVEEGGAPVGVVVNVPDGEVVGDDGVDLEGVSLWRER
jgi:hypothetical protein